MPVIRSADGLNTMHGTPPSSLFAIRRRRNLPEVRSCSEIHLKLPMNSIADITFV
jgi:hypothetical protein